MGLKICIYCKLKSGFKLNEIKFDIEIIIFLINQLRGPGGLHQNALEIDFIVVSDRGE